MEAKLRSRRDTLETFWDQGLQGRALLQAHTQFVDGNIISSFNGCPAAGEGMALIALGGYGRKELFPYSDIDLLLLYDKAREEHLDKVAEAVFYPLWDAGLEVGHSVRTVKQCLEAAEEDYFFQVALLDGRLLAGSERLFEDLDLEFRQNYIEGSRPIFLEGMLYHRNKRHANFGLHSYMLEPHIKESRGGLRDIQAMMWVTHVFFSLYELKGMEFAGLLNRSERLDFEKAWDHLIKIRNRLHYQSGRKNDQLYFEHQEEMSRAMGYRDEDSLLAVEHFMRDVHDSMQTVAVITDLFFEHVEEIVDRTTFRTDTRDEVLEKGVIARQGKVHLADSVVLEDKPYLLMRLFAEAARKNYSIHHRTRKIIKDNLHLVTDRLSKSRRLARDFFQVVSNPEACPILLQAMLETGLLSAYIPEFKHIESLSLHDVYHIYTVDQHLVQSVLELGRLQEGEEKVLVRIAKPEILYFAALLHDIGKGQGSGHSEKGAELAEKTGHRIGLAESDLADLTFLIRHHLFLAEVAMRRDLEDEKLIFSCARTIGTRERLDMLYLLTIADSRATGPNAWSQWKAALIQELYLRISHILEQGHSVEPVTDQASAEEWMRDQVTLLLGSSPGVDISAMPADYLLGFTLEEIKCHADLIRSMKDQEIIVESFRHHGHWSLLVITDDRAGLLARICGVLTLNNLAVLNARVCTWHNGTVVDVLQVKSTIDNTYEGQNWEKLEKELHLAVRNRLGLEYRLSQRFADRRTVNLPVQKRSRAQVKIDNQGSERFTIIEIYADNRFGLLYDITRTLSDFGLNISRAKIGTSGDQLVDVFYVQDENRDKLREKDLIAEIRNSLLHAATCR